MKRKILSLMLVLMTLFLVGCNNSSPEKIASNFANKVKSMKNYYVEATMILNNNDDTFEYDVKVDYLKGDYYKVNIVNKANNYMQTILKNDEGVFVINPSLNKSFKFQSDWPYNNSQAYLLQSIKDDIENTKELAIIQKDSDYILTTNVRYPNNSNLIKQNLTFDKDHNLKKVEVTNKDDIAFITVNFNKIEENITNYTKEYFSVENNINNMNVATNESNENSQTTGVIDDNIFPLYVPTGTSLSSKEVINKDDGQRVIMTFGGDNPFLLVEETVSSLKEHEIIPTSGEPYMLVDTVGVLTSDSVSWMSNGIEYYLVSDVMSTKELLEVAKSIGTIPTMK